MGSLLFEVLLHIAITYLTSEKFTVMAFSKSVLTKHSCIRFFFRTMPILLQSLRYILFNLISELPVEQELWFLYNTKIPQTDAIF